MLTQELAAVTMNVLTLRMFYIQFLPVTFMTLKPMPPMTSSTMMTTTTPMRMSARTSPRFSETGMISAKNLFSQ